ncbi:MAG: hypothetical protein DRH24_05270 [Deltaproteobacteria bacterium]|nr:MAG: hypothetical protein DRH24_05270 [Deltaproteobacteria bacterium]
MKEIKANGTIMFLCMIGMVLFWACTLFGSESQSSRIIVLISRNIIPYLEAVEGLNNLLAAKTGIETEVVLLDRFKGKDQRILVDKILGGRFDLNVAVGPEAARFFWENFNDPFNSMIYTMVLDPEKIFGSTDKVCGISLNIPVGVQIREVAGRLPFLKRIGLLYDPYYNESFYLKAVESAASAGLDIIPLKISSKKHIPKVLNESFGKVDALWFIPDPTIISESIIQYIIKEALLKKIPAIGFNRFFFESGASLVFVFDYEELGAQTAKLVLKILKGGGCKKNVPVFKAMVNLRVMERFGIVNPNGSGSRQEELQR